LEDGEVYDIVRDVQDFVLSLMKFMYLRSDHVKWSLFVLVFIRNWHMEKIFNQFFLVYVKDVLINLVLVEECLRCSLIFLKNLLDFSSGFDKPGKIIG